MLKIWLKVILYRLRGWCPPTEILINRGMKVGKNFNRLNDCILDPGHCWLIEIGNNVTLAPRVHILCHDASTKKLLGYTKVGKVQIGNNVFIGANTVILPGSKIGNNVIIGAQSLIIGEIPSDSVVVGSPAKVIYSLTEFMTKMKKCMNSSNIWNEKYTTRGGIDYLRKEEMQRVLNKSKIGFVN